MGRQLPPNPADDGLEGFFKQIEKLVDKLAKLSKKLQHMEKDIDEVGQVARTAKRRFEALDKDNLANRQKPGCGPGTGVDRSRTSMTKALKKKFKDRMSEFQTLRETIHNEYREIIERRVFTGTGEKADEHTIDRLMETGDGEQIFKYAIQEHGRGQVMDTLAEIQERHGAVREMERKLLTSADFHGHGSFG